MRFDKRAVLASLFMSLACASAHAVDYKDEYDKKIKASQNVGVLGNGLAGDSINFANGTVSFNVTDISLPGNGLGLSLARSYQVEFDHYIYSIHGTDPYYEPELFYRRLYTFGDWDLDVPHIRATMTQDGGWVIDSQTPNNRCSVVGQLKADGTGPASGAPPMALGTRSWHFPAGMYWSGYDMHVPGGDQSLLKATESYPLNQKPTTGGPYHWTTNKDWWVSCVAAANVAGEGFVAVSPEGTKYTFDWLGKRKVNSVSDYDPDIMQAKRPSYLFRSEYRMLATRVEDRFGNWVTYTWSSDEFPRLLSMSSGTAGTPAQTEQTITLTYNSDGYVWKANDGTREWVYTYDSGTLTRVTLPDGTFWAYQLDSDYPSEDFKVECSADEQIPKNSPEYYHLCFGRGEPQPLVAVGSVDHPSGARISFEWTNRFVYSPTANGMYPMALKSKTITGPGLLPATWRYDSAYSKEELRNRCAPLDGVSFTCPPWYLMDELAPDGSLTRRFYDFESILQGELRGSLVADGAGSPTIGCNTDWGCEPSTETSAFATTTPIFYQEIQYKRVTLGQSPGYLEKIGTNPLLPITPGAQVFMSERRIPTRIRTLKQQGVTFTNTVDSFNEFAQPAQVTSASSGSAGGAFSRTEENTYAHDPAKWVIGKPKKTRSVDADITMSETIYNASMLPSETKAFGVSQNTMTYHANGTLATVTDGRGNEIELTQWKRGIPGRIDYPTAVHESATIDDLGQIQDTTDELGNVHEYDYDVMGRLTDIRYPTGDLTTWNPLDRGFVQVTGCVQATTCEYKIAPGYWKQTVQTGNGKATTYYDGLWRPILVVTEDTSLPASKSFVVTRYDGEGRVEFQSYPMGTLTDIAATTFKGVATRYDALGRVHEVEQDSELVTGPLLTTTEYLTGFVTRTTNPRNYVSETKYQVFDNPATEAPVEIVSAKSQPEQQKTTILRDMFGKPLSVTRSGVSP